MYIIYNNDGSLKIVSLDTYIQQGNDGVNKVFVAVERRNVETYTAEAYFELPNGDLNRLTGVVKNEIIDGSNYAGYEITLTAAQTVYAGSLNMNLVLKDNNNNTLYTYTREFTVNRTSVEIDEGAISKAEFEALMRTLSSYQLKYVVQNVRFYASENSAIEDLPNLAAKQLFFIAKGNSISTHFKKSDGTIGNLNISVDFLKTLTGATLGGTTEFVNTDNEEMKGKIVVENNFLTIYNSNNQPLMSFKVVGDSLVALETDMNIGSHEIKGFGDEHIISQDESGTTYVGAEDGTIIINGISLRPVGNETTDLGSQNYKYDNLYIAGAFIDSEGNRYTLQQLLTYTDDKVLEEHNRAVGVENDINDRIDREVEDLSQAIEDAVSAEAEERERVDATKEDLSNKTNNMNSTNENDYPTVPAMREFVNSSINALAAYYITKDAEGNAFETRNELLSATVFYSGGVQRTPTKNDYAIVRVDETQSNATTRYSYQRDGSYTPAGWDFQYVVNESPFTQAQLLAINSGITAEAVASYEQGLLDIVGRVRYEDVERSDGYVSGIYINGQFYNVATNVELTPNVSFVQSISDLPSYNDNKLYFVLDNDALYRYGANNWVEISIYNPMNYVTTYSDQTINATKTFALGKGVAFATSGRLLELRAGFGGIGIYNLSGEEEELYNIGYLGITPYGEKSLGTENNKWANVYANKVNGRNVLQRFALTSDGHTIKLDNVVQTYQQIKALCEDIDNKDVILFFGDMILQPVADDGEGMCEFTTTFNYMGKTQLVRVSINQENQLKVKYVALCELGDDDKVDDSKLLFATTNEIRGLR